MENWESLTKEDFWNDLYDKYPLEMKVFCDWIDKYKKEVDWNNLFSNSEIDGECYVKFHDIPNAMQVGIFIAFTQEQEEWIPFHGDVTIGMDHVIDEIKNWFKVNSDNNKFLLKLRTESESLKDCYLD